MSENIPKRIFYVWGADEFKPARVNLCILSWHQTMPDYEIIEINENSTEYFNFREELKNNKYFKTVYERKMFAFAADYIRLKILYNNGGIYFDTDVYALQSFDKFLAEPAFIGIQGNTSEIGREWVEPAILGAGKGNPFIKQILDFYDREIMDTPLFILPDIFAEFLSESYNLKSYPDKDGQGIIRLKDITIYPEKYFIPYRLNQTFSVGCIENDTHAMHLFAGSWDDNNVVWFQKHKHKAALPVLDFIVLFRKTIQNIFSLRNTMKNNTKIKILTILGKEFKISKK